MLLELFQWLARDFRAFNVFQYITLRTVLAAMTALAMSFLIGPRMIRKLTEMKVGQSVRDDGPQSHLIKAGTPTMGGALILTAVAITTLLWADLENRYVWACLITTIGFGVIGWIDDYRKVVHKNSKGLSARYKFFWQTVIAAVALSFLAYRANLPQQTDLIVPFFKTVAIPLVTLGFIVLGWFVVVGFSNAVNLTDGLDGLAIMPTVMVASALAIFAYVAGNRVFSTYLGVPHIAGAGELAVFCGAIAGAGLAFLWFNAYPAEVFMGDVGALALGGAIGFVALATKTELSLPIIAGVFVVELFSDVIQVGYFKATGKRVFLMAPIHHHFEKMGWPESRIVVRFWIVSFSCAVLGLLLTLKVR